jgi:hypothetical protein
MSRVSHKGQAIDDADAIECARGSVRGLPAGRYEVEEIRADPFASGRTSRSWARIIGRPDGRVEAEPWPSDRLGT